jgi:hypothetical protein
MKIISKILRGCLAGSLLSLSCDPVKNDNEVEEIAYPQPRPDSVAIAFLPGIVSSDSVEFGSAFSPDGKSFYFSRKTNNHSAIYASHYNENNWSEPVLVPFADTKHAEADPAFSPDGKLHFISTRPKNESDTLMDYDIWFVKQFDDGRWSNPENAETVNSDSAEYYISFSKSGNLYFASSRKGGFGQEDIYVSKLVDEKYMRPENLGALVNTGFSEYDPAISSMEDLIIFTSSNRDDGFGSGDLYFSIVENNQTWGQAHNLGNGFNTASREYCSYFTHDGEYFFFSSDGNIQWISSTFVRKKVHNR